MKERLKRWLTMCLGSVALTTLTLGIWKGRESFASRKGYRILFEDCREELDIEKSLSSACAEKKRTCQESWRTEVAERERAAEARYLELYESKAGEECWARVQKLEKMREEEVDFYHWRLKFCGAIRDKSRSAIARYEKQVDALLNDSERSKLEDD